MRSYSSYVTDILEIAHDADEQTINPQALDAIATHGRTAHNSRVGYMNRLCKVGLLEKVGDPRQEQYRLTDYGVWVYRMYKGGWTYTNEKWVDSVSEMELDSDAIATCRMLGIVPIVSDLREK